MMTVKIEFDAKLIQSLLDQVPVLAQLAALESGIRPAAKVLEKRVKALVPRSSETGSTKKWSKSTKSQRASERSLRDLVRTKVLKPKNNSASALVGFEWPGGNKGHFVVPMKKDTRKQVLWGKQSGKEVRKGDDFLRQAFDETKQSQTEVFVRNVSRAVDKKMKDLGLA